MAGSKGLASFLVLLTVSNHVYCQSLLPNGDCNNDKTICTYNWEITYIETMAFYNKTTGSGVPVVIRNGQFFKRVLNNECDQLLSMTKEEVDQILTADGAYRTAMVINGELPGPPIIVNNGTEVVVNVRNSLLMEGITIHWHGMVQHNTPWMDGVGSVSQCPINPGETFTYRFLATPPGTHWYHSHFGTQRTDGLYGALIVLEPDTMKNTEAPNPVFKGEFLMLLHDWMREPSLDINNRILREMERFTPGYNNTEQCFYQTRQSDGTEIGVTPFISGLINGKGRHYNSDGLVENDVIPMAWFNVTRKSHYRFRLISASMMYAFRVSIDNHDLHVFATDGNPTETTTAQSIIIHSGERFDFYIYTSQHNKNFWIRAETLEVENIKDEPILAGQVRAGLHYKTVPMMDPTSQPDECTSSEPCSVINCPFRYFPNSTYTDCIPIASLKAPTRRAPPNIPKDLSHFQEIFINFHFSGGSSLKSSVNGRAFIPPSTPPMILPKGNLSDHITMCDDKECERNHCDCTYFIELTTGNVVQVILYNIRLGEGLQGTAHPVHFHGHHFYVLKTGYGFYNNETGKFINDTTDIDCGGSKRCNAGKWSDSTWKGDGIPGLNLQNPPIKDTVIVPVGGYVVIRFVADNPGWWFVHCHIEIHQVEGMALMLKEGNVTEMITPPKDFKTCGNFWWSDDEFRKKLAGKHEPVHTFGDGHDVYFWLAVVVLPIVSLLFVITVGYLCGRIRRQSNYQQMPEIN
ncbi:uncharacterized protein LOC144452935 isoform X1 [Glandiceps talaboti]